MKFLLELVPQCPALKVSPCFQGKKEMLNGVLKGS